MSVHPLVRVAAATAATWHTGQVDKIGMPYVGHLGRVAEMVMQSSGSPEQVAAAWLHDVIEDTECTAENLSAAGMPESVVELVLALTHTSNLSDDVYWHQVRSVPDALLIKFCDNYDNLDPRRLARVDRRTANRLRVKYGSALKALCTVDGDSGGVKHVR